MRQLISKNILTLLTMLILTSCHYNNQYLNREEDKKEAEQVTNKLYDLLKAKDYEGTTSLFSKKFFEVTDKEKLLRLYSTTNEKLGDLTDTEVEIWETRVVEGSNPISNYTFVYKNKYTNFVAKETINLTKDEDGQLRIVGYNINSDGFLNI